MPNLVELNQWENGIYQLETNDPVMGGVDGIDNLQAKQLANRTQYLKAQQEAHAAAADPHPQYMTEAESSAAIATAVAALVNSSPAALDTLAELATALGNDPNFAATLTAALAGKASWASVDEVLTAAGITINHNMAQLLTALQALFAAKAGAAAQAFSVSSLTMLQANAGASAAGEWTRNANYGTYYKAPAAGSFADIGLASSGGTYALWIGESGISLNKSGQAVGNFDGKIGTAVSASPTTLLNSAEPFGALHLINGNSAGNIFSDLVYASNSQFLVLASHASSGSPAARTYSVVAGGTLQLTMASGTYAVTASRMRGSL